MAVLFIDSAEWSAYLVYLVVNGVDWALTAFSFDHVVSMFADASAHVEIVELVDAADGSAVVEGCVVLCS